MKKDKEIKKWYNEKFVQENFKKKNPLEKIKSDIDENRRIFFAVEKEISHEQIISTKIQKAEETIEPKKKKKKRIWSAILFIVNVLLVVLVFWNFANEQGGVQPLSTLIGNNPKWTYIFIAIGLYFATVLFNSLKFLFLIHNKTRKWKFWFSFKLATIGRYYDLVTPLGSGGQPFEIYYMKKNGYSGDVSTAIPLAKYMFWQIAFLLICLIILIFFPQTYASSTLVTVCAWVGLAIILALFLFVFFMSITRKWGASLVVSVLKLLHKMKIVKDYRKALQKVLRFVKQYQNCIKSFAKSPFTVIMVILSTMASIISNALIAYFVYISFADVRMITWWEIVCKCVICELAVSFFPLPGGSGATELSFNALLGALFPEGTLFWGILIWRILTYYLYIFQGAIILVWDMFASRIHRKKAEIIKDIKPKEVIHDPE